MQINSLWQETFTAELVENLRKASNDFNRQLLIIDVAKECIMYSCDMCLEYYRQGAFYGITTETIDNITYNVCIAMNSVVKEFGFEQRTEVMSRVRNLLSDPSTYEILQGEINRYYKR